MARLLLVLGPLLLAACGPTRPPLPPDACRPAAREGARPWESRGYGMAVPWFAPRRGAPRPRVVIQAFSDFQCPHCARALPQLDRVVEDFGACVQIVWRNYPLAYHEHAELAARAAMEVYRQRGDGAFWAYHDRLFSDQDHLERADLERAAQSVEGLDLEAFRAALGSDAHRDVIERDRASADATGVRIGTPSFFVNGHLLSGARPYPAFRRAIEDALLETYQD